MTLKSRLSEFHEEIVAAVAAGYSDSEIGERYDVCGETVRYYRNNRGIVRDPRFINKGGRPPEMPKPPRMNIASIYAGRKYEDDPRAPPSEPLFRGAHVERSYQRQASS